MALQMQPVSFSNLKLNPFAASPATSLVDFLRPESEASCLLLGGCDPRKLLYTLYMELNTGFPRKFDFTWCEEEPAILARDILFLTFLLDTKGEDTNPELWNIFHNFYINPTALKLISDQSAKLARLSHTADSWSDSPYGTTLQILNTETLLKLNAVWKRISGASVPDKSVYTKYRKMIQEIHIKHWSEDIDDELQETPYLARSFGPTAIYGYLVCRILMRTFWGKGVADEKDIPQDPAMNPLFRFFWETEDWFGVNYRATPLSVYHFADTVHQMKHVPTMSKKTSPPLIVASAKAQFKSWCKAFLQVVNTADKSRIQFRFIIADPLAFSMALQQRNSRTENPLVNHSTSWSGTELVLDIPAVTPNPKTFNVIDTGYLSDRIGGINLLVATVPLMHVSPSSTIQMEPISRPWSEETFLLQQMLLCDTSVMCTLLGVAPLPYLTGVTTRGFMQDLPFLADFSKERPVPGLNRVIWKIPSSGDSRITEQMRLSFEPSELACLLFALYTEMFLPLDLQGAPKGVLRPFRYVVGSLTAFLAFLRHRFESVDWDKIINSFLCELENVPRMSFGMKFYHDLLAQLYFSGVHNMSDWVPDRIIDVLRPKLPAFKYTSGVLNSSEPPTITCVILTVPRSVLQPMYDECIKGMEGIKYNFEVRLQPFGVSYYDASTPLPLFGKLEANGKTCHIERDPREWHGSSDVHFCVYVPTNVLLLGEAAKTKISLNLISNTIVRALFVGSFGSQLEVFAANILDESNVHLCSSIPDRPKPVPRAIINAQSGSADRTTGSLCEETTGTDGSFSMTHPKLHSLAPSQKPVFTRRITLLTDASRESLISNSKIDVTQSSPCTVTVTYGPVEHLFQFPYPVDGRASTLRVSRKSGWLEIRTPLSNPKDTSGGYSRFPSPLARETDSLVPCSWNLPSVNFNRLYQVKFPVKNCKVDLKWLHDHLNFLISDQESQDLGKLTVCLEYKICVVQMCRMFCGYEGVRTHAFGISIDGDTKFVFLFNGLYIDNAWHSIVLDGYCLEVTPEFKKFGYKLPPRQQWDLNDKDGLTTDLLELWRSSLPAMIERCRDWEHKETCEYKMKTPMNENLICSCGKGKVQPEFLTVKEWAGFAPKVVRFALSPLVSEPFIEQTRHQMLSIFQKGLQNFSEKEFEELRKLKACFACGSIDKTKKCGRCGKVYYCGRECQQGDWKRHKPDCS